MLLLTLSLIVRAVLRRHRAPSPETGDAPLSLTFSSPPGRGDDEHPLRPAPVAVVE